MSGKILLSTAYLPPVEYFSVLAEADEILIEKEENYRKQTYRNRCYILSSHGPQMLSVPVYQGSYHKTALKDITIDYSKRWQQVHLRAMTAAYRSAPFFEFYFEAIMKIISGNYKYLLDLNMELMVALMEFLRIKKNISYTTIFEPVSMNENDFRYRISPKIESGYVDKEYLQVFNNNGKFVSKMSSIDLIFNTGPDAYSTL